ncbi:hypothetical protein [Allonocardiopsis opalescens]|uniref:Mce-associated membrane protein n=1 Tax=Allonocardiopsis opalescens TaxID=1144618 RepID=A0A2T0QDA7_9ACTN|nr:hypothetical protein [Allonocardiopsis opalescens]PRY01936.1 hypothetical protein CLV72_101534 [Allonocardiopsis opalescens]
MARELSDGQRKALFGVLVLVLVAFGGYILFFRPDGGQEVAAEPDPGAEAAAGAPSTPAGPPPDAAEPAEGGASASGGAEADVFAWFPVDREELLAAAAVAEEFAVEYTRFDYRESVEDAVARMNELSTEEFAGGAASAGGGAAREERVTAQTVTTSTATIDAVRDMSASTVIFEVGVRTSTAEAGGAPQDDAENLLVTVVYEGGAWLVYDLAPADVGNQGEG